MTNNGTTSDIVSPSRPRVAVAALDGSPGVSLRGAGTESGSLTRSSGGAPRKLVSAAVAALAMALLATAYLGQRFDAHTNPAKVDLTSPRGPLNLGIDVSAVPRTTASVRAYLATLQPATRNTLLRACEAYSYQLDPTTEDRKILAFCGIALGG